MTTERTGKPIVSGSCIVAVCDGVLESVTLKVSELVPVAVGVPLMVPVEGSRVSPVGSRPDCTCHTYGNCPPLAASVFK